MNNKNYLLEFEKFERTDMIFKIIESNDPDLPKEMEINFSKSLFENKGIDFNELREGEVFQLSFEGNFRFWENERYNLEKKKIVIGFPIDFLWKKTKLETWEEEWETKDNNILILYLGESKDKKGEKINVFQVAKNHKLLSFYAGFLEGRVWKVDPASTKPRLINKELEIGETYKLSPNFHGIAEVSPINITVHIDEPHLVQKIGDSRNLKLIELEPEFYETVGGKDRWQNLLDFESYIREEGKDYFAISIEAKKNFLNSQTNLFLAREKNYLKGQKIADLEKALISKARENLTLKKDNQEREREREHFWAMDNW